MKNIEWHPFFYNGLETNFEVTEFGKVRKVPKEWHGNGKGKSKIVYGEIDESRFSLNNSKYYCISVAIKNNGSKSLFIHQIVASVFHGYLFNSRKYVVDHIDSNKLNNNKSNLRILTYRENCSKEKVMKSNLPVGVYWNKNENKYRSHIRIGKQRFHLGYFKNVDEASKAYQQALGSILI
jgi:hypothetical protein